MISITSLHEKHVYGGMNGEEKTRRFVRTTAIRQLSDLAVVQQDLLFSVELLGDLHHRDSKQFISEYEFAPHGFADVVFAYIQAGTVELIRMIVINIITRREYDKVLDYAVNANLKNVFIQELSSSDETFVPDFNIK